MSFIQKNKKMIIMAGVGIFLIVGGLLSWKFYFSKYKIFHDYEKEFTEAVEYYYHMNSNYLPGKTQAREMTLQDLYDGNHISDLYIPGSKKLCDSNSWVRVYQNEKGEYEYTTYLKCGKFESKVDHIGPEITLNGDSTIMLSLGSTYEELGVKSVKDNKDGEMDPSSVVIDSSKLDTNKIGDYKITYTVRDKTYNKTVVTRTVTVSQNLTEVVRNNTDSTNYYRGENPNNYLLFSGMLWRIVDVGEDGSVVLISDSNITYLRMNYETYQNSNVDHWLTHIFYDAISSKEYLVDKSYCVGNITSTSQLSNSCSETITSKVGLLSMDEYNLTVSNNTSYLNNGGGYFALSHKIGDNYLTIPMDDNGIQSGILAPIRPVVAVKSNILVVSGNGTRENPYKLDDYEYGKVNDYLNQRMIGEYVEYSGLEFRIIGIDQKKNVQVIMAQPWMIQPGNNRITVSMENVTDLKFNLLDEENPGYLFNHDYLDYIDTKYLLDMEYEIPSHDASLSYHEYKSDTIKAKIILPKTYELFSAIDDNFDSRTANFLYIDQSASNQNVFVSTGGNTLLYEMLKDNFHTYDIKPVMTLQGDVKLAGGKGTVNNPYKLK